MGVYKWKEGSWVSGDAQKVGEWIEGIQVKTPENIVNEAEDEKSPGHKYFTWDDYKAAHYWRLQEARLLINSIVTVAEDEDVEMPAYESVIINEKRQYVPTTIESLTEQDIWNQISGEAQSTIKSLRHKLKIYSHIRKEQSEKAQQYLQMASEAIK